MRWLSRVPPVALPLALCAFVQTWCVARAVTPALDSVRAIAIAQAIDLAGPAQTLAHDDKRPLFALSVWAMHALIGAWGGLDTWARSAQFAAAWPLVAAVPALLAVLRRWVGLRAAGFGCLLFVALPSIAQLGADGAPDSTHLALFIVALWAAVTAIESHGAHQLARLTLTGAILGLACLVRREALVLAPAVILWLTWQSDAWRTRLASAVVASAALALGFAIVAGPYLTWRHNQPLGGALEDFTPAQLMNAATLPVAIEAAAAFPVRDPEASTRFRGLAATLTEAVHELVGTLHYWVGGLAVVGMWRMHRRPLNAVAQLSLIFTALYIPALLVAASQWGYLSDRHMLPLAALAMAPAGHGALYLGRRLSRSWSLVPRPWPLFSRPSFVLVLAILGCLAASWSPMHSTRLGYRQAGQWLAENSSTGAVLDTRGWTALFSGRPTYRPEAAGLALADPQLEFFVLEAREIERDTARGRELRALLAERGDLVADFLPPHVDQKYRVLVYRWRPIANHLPMSLKDA